MVWGQNSYDRYLPSTSSSDGIKLSGIMILGFKVLIIGCLVPSHLLVLKGSMDEDSSRGLLATALISLPSRALMKDFLTSVL